MFNRPNRTPVGAAPKAFGAATLRQSPGGTACQHTAPLDRQAVATRVPSRLAELLVTIGVLVLLVLLFTQLLNSAATITTSVTNKWMRTHRRDSCLIEWQSISHQMVKRTDVDYYVKTVAPTQRAMQPGNDQIAFYSAVPGYYPSSGSQSPVSLVAYRVNSNRLPRHITNWSGWEKVSFGTVSPTDTPVVFLPLTISIVAVCNQPESGSKFTLCIRGGRPARFPVRILLSAQRSPVLAHPINRCRGLD